MPSSCDGVRVSSSSVNIQCAWVARRTGFDGAGTGGSSEGWAAEDAIGDSGNGCDEVVRVGLEGRAVDRLYLPQQTWKKAKLPVRTEEGLGSSRRPGGEAKETTEGSTQTN